MYPLIAGAVLAAASAGMQMAANEKTKKAMRNVVDAELARQKGYQQRGSAIAQASQAASTPQAAQGQVDAGAKQREAAYKDVAQRQLGTYSPQEKAVSKEQQAGTEMKAASSDAERAANAGWSDWLHNQMVKDIIAQRKLAVNSGLSRESADVMNYELQSAQGAGDSLRGWAGVVGGAGRVAGAARGFGGSGGEGFTPENTYENPWLDQSVLKY